MMNRNWLMTGLAGAAIVAALGVARAVFAQPSTDLEALAAKEAGAELAGKDAAIFDLLAKKDSGATELAAKDSGVLFALAAKDSGFQLAKKDSGTVELETAEFAKKDSGSFELAAKDSGLFPR